MPSSGPGTRNWPRRFGMCCWPEPGNAARRRVSPLRARHQSDLSKLLFLRRESVLPLAGLVAYLWVGWLIHQERSEEHTSELQSLMRTSYAVFCLKKKKHTQNISRKQSI